MPGYHWLPDRLKVKAQARRGLRDRRSLQRSIPGFESDPMPRDPEFEKLFAEVPARLSDYIQATGTDGVMAASTELCRFLLRWCDLRRPSRLVDLGSGITSWTLRAWRDRCSPDSTVISVDDDADWLARSRDYSDSAGTGDRGFLLWDEFIERQAGESFDLVVHDFGSVRERARKMGEAFRLVAPGGAIICDDIHKARIWRAARDTMRRSGLPGWSLREETLDSIGRFALLSVRPPIRP
ncbi:MAG: class I SAM-dependent methyltransferase [Gemmatimonadota bacterium]